MAHNQPVERTNTNVTDHETDLKADINADIEEVVINRLTEEDVNRVSQESLTFWSKTGLRICLIMFVMGCNQAGYGVDWAVISGINSLDSWHSYFGFGNAGSTYGVINALMTIGTFCGAPFLALADVCGRRGINFIGNGLIVVAALMQGLAPNLKVFMAGRFILGFGSAMVSAPQYMAEIAPTHMRGRLVGIFGACFQVGSICMNAAMIGLSTINGNLSWRIPLLLEALFPGIVCLTIYLFCPESPRYRIMQGRREDAKKIIAKYQTTSGEVDQHIVEIVVAQIDESLENDKAGYTKYWDYRCFFTKVVRYRLMLLILYSIFQQWNGGGIIGWNLSPALDLVGITKSIDQLGINLGLTATYFVFTSFGAYIIDIFRRRTLIFSGLITIIIMQVLSTITAWRYSVSPSKATADLTILWLFLFQMFSASLIATMHNLYPVEILSLALRAKGMGLYGMIQGAAGTVQAYGISVGIGKIGYKIFVVYIVYNLIQLVLSYFLFPETHGLTLEEIDAVFETKGVHPVKMSLDIENAKKERQAIFQEPEVR